jgi:hypothetical protein
VELAAQSRGARVFGVSVARAGMLGGSVGWLDHWI